MKTTTLLKTVCYLSLFSVSLAIAAPLKQTTPSKDFIDNKDGTVTHKKTKLTWQRCSVGQTWMEGGTCSGDAIFFTWYEAMTLTSDFAGKKNWRLPAINELNSIVEYANYAPAINGKVFPNTPSAAATFWSSSPYANFSSNAWIVYFGNGYDYYGNKYDYYFVRLVRGGQ